MKEKARTRAYDHDDLFHSLAGLLEIEARRYREGHDVFRDCRTREWPFG
jgi:glucan phosphoethanolaminetransferase (alkaline phosphatase superfamily)